MKILRGLLVLVGVAAAGAITLYLLGYLRIEVTNADPRPHGTAWDIQSLHRRDDVNVLFILTDTLRAHRLSAYGYERETSPTFDYMASTGVRFARQLAQSSWTKCSMTSLWTGLYPQRTGVLRSPQAVPEGARMPAEILREAGFRTAGIWRNGWVAPSFGFGQGFEVYEKPAATRVGPNIRIENPHIKLEGTDNDSIDAAIEFLRVHGRERWFLYVHLMDVHQYLYDTQSALFGSGYSDIYDNAIRHTDEIIGRLLTHLVDQGLLDNTLVIMAADHGEAFGERGIEGHAREVFRETTEVPLVIGFPFQLDPPGAVVDVRTRNIDIWPTVLDLLGLPELPETDGRSLVPEIIAAASGRPIEDERVGIAHLDRSWGRKEEVPARPAIAVAKGMFRYVLQRGTDEPGDPTRELLFDASKDPLETTNVLDDEPEIADDLRHLAMEYQDMEPPWDSGPVNVEIDEDEAERLRALGYALP
jgi:arylsulfatase A-like enzyme